MKLKLNQIVYDASSNDSIDKLQISNKQIIQLGIQGLPGTRFHLNNFENLYLENTLCLGASGIFELDLSNSNSRILSISFGNLNNLDEYKSTKTLLIIDYLEEIN